MAKLGSVDLSISDNGIFWDGIAIEFDPTLDALQASGVADGGVPWNKRCYGLASKALEIRCPSGMDLQLSAPADPPDQRFTRLSIDTRMAFVDTIPNAHFVVAIS
jgi:hypothetical protein